MSNVKTDKKGGTRGVPPPTNEGDQGRVTAKTVVVDGPTGMKRLRALTRAILRTTRARHSSRGGITDSSTNRQGV